MCGIAGIISFDNSPVQEEHVKIIMKKIKHRGPDDEDVYVKDHFGLGHVRLSIIDLSSAGRQPMFSEDGRFCIVFNGEIYNYIELREELSSSYNFRTKTDTEVILAAYQVWGQKCLDKFNGDWAFVIYDHKTREFFGARDRYGIKPFYYYKDDNQFIFSSEIKGILPLIDNPQINDRMVFEYLIYNKTDQSEETFVRQVKKIRHGHCFTITGNEFKVWKWYNLYEKVHEKDLTFEEYREHLKNTVKLRLRSDVPVGVSLSGGIDSSSILALVYHDMDFKDVNTFSAVYGKDKWADESSFIDEFTPILKKMHYTSPSADTFYNDYLKFITSHGEPVASLGPYAQFKVMELAHGNVVVTLDGQGADEQLGGYHNFFGSYFLELLRKARLARLFGESVAYYKVHKSLYAFKYMGFYMLPGNFKKSVGSKLFGNVHKDFFHKFKDASNIDENLYSPKSLRESSIQHFEYKLEHLLKWEDLNSLTFSIESRVPFLDHNLVEATLSLPPEKILRKSTTKYILREAVKDIIPHKIYARVDKKNFATPSDEWFRTEKFKNLINDTIHSNYFKNLGYFDVDECAANYQQHLEGKTDINRDIWKWLNIANWKRIYIDEHVNLAKK